MQRVRTSEDHVQLTDGLDIVTVGYTRDGDIRIYRDASPIDPGNPDVILVNGTDNIGELGEWLSVAPCRDTGIDGGGADLSTKDGEELRVAAISVLSPFDSELTLLLDAAQVVIDKAGEALQKPTRTALDERVFRDGLLQPNRRSALLARHRAGELVLFSEARYYPMPVSTINQLGKWILDGEKSLIKKSIWSK